VPITEFLPGVSGFESFSLAPGKISGLAVGRESLAGWPSVC
jgi:hypothetical protein